jgi:hypothetical protein
MYKKHLTHINIGNHNVPYENGHLRRAHPPFSDRPIYASATLFLMGDICIFPLYDQI